MAGRARVSLRATAGMAAKMATMIAITAGRWISVW
jgi:hypothetical protein